MNRSTRARVVDKLMTFATITGGATILLALTGFALGGIWAEAGQAVFQLCGAAATGCTASLLLLMVVDR